MREVEFAKGVVYLSRNLFLAGLLYASIYTLVHLYETGSTFPAASSLMTRPSDISSPTSGAPVSAPTGGVSSPPSNLKLNRINPHANWFNRPASIVKPKDNFMGRRPHADTVANLTRLVETCRGTYEAMEKVPFNFECQKYLENGESDYYYLPAKEDRASQQSPRTAEVHDADGHGNTLSAYPSHKMPSHSSLGQCNGPIIPLHAYWTGPSTWRLEAFIKGFLYTQNLPCSRLWVWLDCDKNPNAVSDMLERDSRFARFLPLIERGDVVIKPWKFPSRIPLPPGDNTDGKGYYTTPRRANEAGEVAVADGLIVDTHGQEWLVLTDKQKTFLPVAVSDAVRFIVTHLYGGGYLDVDVLLLRDMRPLLIGKDHSFAERWGAHPSPGDYNTAIMSLSANSSLSSYFVRGAVRMGMNFHPLVMGYMAVKDGRNHEFHMLETATVDPIWTEYDGLRQGPCNIPCFQDYGYAFLGSRNAFPKKNEWDGYSDPPMDVILHVADPKDVKPGHQGARNRLKPGTEFESITTFDKDALAKAEYRLEEDNYPPSNRTLEHFFRGSWSYHVHNQWDKNPEPSSWLNVMQMAHNGFFGGERTNIYGEMWDGPKLTDYEVSWEFY